MARISSPFLWQAEAWPVASTWGVLNPWQVQPLMDTGAPPPLPCTLPDATARL
jgi:hypothetical protein